MKFFASISCPIFVKWHWDRWHVFLWYFFTHFMTFGTSIRWCHNGLDSISNHQPHDCLLNRLFRHRSKKTSKLRVTGLCAVNSPHKWPLTRKMTSSCTMSYHWVITNAPVSKCVQAHVVHACMHQHGCMYVVILKLSLWQLPMQPMKQIVSRSKDFHFIGHPTLLNDIHSANSKQLHNSYYDFNTWRLNTQSDMRFHHILSPFWIN